MEAKARLFLLAPGFTDSAYPGERFYCRESAQVEGVLLSFPELSAAIEVARIPFPRPRAPIVALIGEANQSVPVLVLPAGASYADATGSAGGHPFVAGADAILGALTSLYGIPRAHP